MRKVAILLALTMMLAGCTELAEDSTESETYTNQDLEGSYYGFAGFRVDMNADDTYTIYVKELEDCYDDAETAAGEASEYDDDEVVVDGNCIYEEYPIDEEDDITVSSTLGSHMGVPYLMLTVNELNFVCDDGDEIPADWVNDGDEDCSDGEDEADDASDSIGTQKVADVYFSADGFGMLNYEESFIDEMFNCLLLAPTNTRELDMQAYELMEELVDDDDDFDEDDPMSSIPSEVIALYASLDEDFSNSPLSSLVTGCSEDTSFVMSSLIFAVWANSLAEDNTGGDFVMYSFDISDAYGAPTSASGDDLVYIQMTQGDDLMWSDIEVQMSVDGGPYYPCTNPDLASDTGCVVSDNGDGMWVNVEEVTISEGSDNLCDGSCEIQVRILDSAESKLIYESNTIAVV